MMTAPIDDLVTKARAITDTIEAWIVIGTMRALNITTIGHTVLSITIGTT